MKKIISLVMAIALILSFAGCTGKVEDSSSLNSEVTEKIEKLDVNCNVYGISGPTGIGLAYLREKAENNEGLLNYTVTNASANDEIVAKLVNGEADIAAVATNLAATLYKKTNGGIKVLAVNTLGVLSIVTKGEEVNSIADLKDKKVYSTGKGANPEYILNYLLAENGLKAGVDVEVEFVAQPEELITKAVSNEKAIIFAPQPVATAITVKDQNAKIALDINDEWDKVSDTKLVMGCIVARKAYIDENPDAVKAFLKDYNESIEFVNKNVDDAAELCAKYGIVAAAPIAKKAIPHCNIVFEDGKELKKDLSAYLEFLYGANPASVGGELPDDGFYYAVS
ncbi:MAG: ABC transporter substrate-binding protein [Clostridia bacterium]|nr:ABC transporter substrate-binding protein [Clostridia bacterium]